MPIDPATSKAIQFWMLIGNSVVMVVGAIYAWIVNRTKANKVEIDGVKQGVDELGTRITRVEGELENRPGHAEIALLHEKINEVRRQVSETAGKVGSIDSTLQLIHQTLLEDRNKQQ